MKYLLDTHTFLWCVADSSKLPKKVDAEIRNPHNEIFVSAVNLWEIAIKSRLKKIDLGVIAVDDLIGLAKEMGIQLISLLPEESVTYGRLSENSHLDPFDRMLIWQAINRELTMISKDNEFSKFIAHGLKLFWK
jgi:PIN domain nuclease of toxin-antitoxin system